MKITVTLDVDEDIIREESGQENLTDAIGQELGWLRDSGMFVDEWHYIIPEKVLSEEQKGPDVGEVDELVVRLSHLSGVLETKNEISAPEWQDLCSVIADCISTYYVDQQSPTPCSSIEELADKMFHHAFPVEPSLEEDQSLPEYSVSNTDELTVILAHLAGEMEANGHMEAVEWDELIQAIHDLTAAYLNDPSESHNPFCLEDAAERYFSAQFGSKETRDLALSEGWADKTPSELISDAKTIQMEAPKAPQEDLEAIRDTTPQVGTFEYDRVIFREKATGNLFSIDVVNKDDLLVGSDLPIILKSCDCVGVYTNPETGAGYHPSTVSVLWDEIPKDFRDKPDENALAGVLSGRLYDVCYYYTKPGDTDTLYSGVDRSLSRNDILCNIQANKYMEGAVIHESNRMLALDEYVAGMRFNTAECELLMTNEQMHEVVEGISNGVDQRYLMHPELSADELLKLRTELETDNARRDNPGTVYVATDYGPEEVCPGFKSWSNFEKYPDRICYVPENWDEYGYDSPGITGQDIIDECGGDKLKARMVLELCDWQFPSTVLGEWDHDDELALERLRTEEGTGTPQQPRSFLDIVKDAQNRAGGKAEGQTPTIPQR